MKVNRKQAIALVLIAVAVAASIGIYLLWLQYQPGVWLEGEVVLTFEDGSTVMLTTPRSELERLMLTALKRQSIITYGGKKLLNVAAKSNVKFIITPADRTLKTQYYAIYWIEIEGTFADGLRSYTSLWGFTDAFVGSYASTEAMNRWNWMLNLGTWGDYAKFYQEKGSGVQIGVLNVGAEYAKAVCDAMSFNTVTKELAERLTAVTSVTTKQNGAVDILADWQMTGPDFYMDLKRFCFSGAALHIGDFSVGAGRWMRMWNRDSYTVRFKEFVAYRYQDITGEWSPWKSKTQTIAAMTMNVQEGYWYILDVNLGGSVTLT